MLYTCILSVYMAPLYMYIDGVYGCCIHVNLFCIWVLCTCILMVYMAALMVYMGAIYMYIANVYGCYVHVY
jgi:hypothetical protein